MERAASAYVNCNEEDEMEVLGHSPCCWKLALVSLGTVCSGGFLLLFLYWLPELSVKWTCRAVPLRDAWVVLLRTLVRFFTQHNMRYLWWAEYQVFQRLTALDRGQPGLARSTQDYRKLFYGANQVPSLACLLVKEPSASCCGPGMIIMCMPPPSSSCPSSPSAPPFMPSRRNPSAESCWNPSTSPSRCPLPCQRPRQLAWCVPVDACARSRFSQSVPSASTFVGMST